MSAVPVSGAALYAEMSAWSAGSRVSISALALRAGIDPGHLSKIARRTPLPATVARLRAAMASDWRGYSVRRRGPSVLELDGSYRGPVPVAQLVERDPCGWCGVRRDVGCRHHPRVPA